MSVATDWILALSSTAAAAGTVGTLYASVITLRRQVDNERRAQASRVTAVTIEPGLSIQVSNHSDRAIYGVTAVEDGAAGGEPRPIAWFAVLEPGQSELIDIADATTQARGMTNVQRVDVAFTDEAGVQWSRHVDGPLHELKWRRTDVAGPGWFRPLPRWLRRFLIWTGDVRLQPPRS